MINLRMQSSTNRFLGKKLSEFLEWFDANFEMPRELDVNITGAKYIINMSDQKVDNNCFCPNDPAENIIIHFSTGDFLERVRKYSKENALNTEIFYLLHDIQHYYQFANDWPLDDEEADDIAYDFVDRYADYRKTRPEYLLERPKRMQIKQTKARKNLTSKKPLTVRLAPVRQRQNKRIKVKSLNVRVQPSVNRLLGKRLEEFLKWFDLTYEIPQRLDISITGAKYVFSLDDRKPSEEVFIIRFSTGDFFEKIRKDGKEIGLNTEIHSLLHQIQYYYQFIDDRLLDWEEAEEVADKITNKYADYLAKEEPHLLERPKQKRIKKTKARRNAVPRESSAVRLSSIRQWHNS